MGQRAGGTHGAPLSAGQRRTQASSPARCSGAWPAWHRALRYCERYEREDRFGQAVLVQVWGGKGTRRTHPPASAHHASKASKPPSPEHEFPTTPLASGLRGAGGGAVENSATVASNDPRCRLRHLNAGLENHSHPRDGRPWNMRRCASIERDPNQG